MVNPGEFMESVIAKCGEPYARSGSEILGREAFHYNCGEGYFNHTFRFHDGILRSIVRTGERGQGLADWQRTE